jgi:hypothetical protein
MTNWSQTTTKSIQFNNNMNNFVKYYPLIGNKIVFNENEIKINPILDKSESNKCYILMNSSLNPMTKQINPILVPNLSDFQIKNINKNNEIDLENENQLINNKKELPALKNGIKIYLNYRRIRDPRAYTHLTIIRKRKMKKHQRRKWRNKMLAFIKKRLLRRNIRKEKQFRAELLAQIKEAEDFDPQKYVQNILQTIDNMPKPETFDQKIERIKDLIRKNRKQTNLISPKFED